jgi:hypothetical protein
MQFLPQVKIIHVKFGGDFSGLVSLILQQNGDVVCALKMNDDALVLEYCPQKSHQTATQNK